MSKVLLSVICLLSSLTVVFVSCGSGVGKDMDYFEGVITYKNKVIRKTNKYDSVTLAKIAGESAKTYVNRGNYLALTENAITNLFLYRNNENRIYYVRFNNDTVFWADASKPGEKILDFAKRKNVKKVMNIDCDELTLIYANRTVKYYYNPDTLRLNPKWFKKSTISNENFISQEMGAVSLETVIEHDEFIITITAVGIQQQKIDTGLFAVPGTILKEEN